ncbi:uncharacterized protein APUU_30412S [Aspergillus puulaauensis]|uniref:Uncharacterized protein n=1 Tax=Aspergillus puulaauensis TaxID=1220207 RepID=A0A7R7XJ07_9EURO|nr:uncharacterized protein APUU_30412S [Aspergillus puulaauensis]BCS22187.1 hypothetical protein APUU_30412S [Aspergillus puulaauensis]
MTKRQMGRNHNIVFAKYNRSEGRDPSEKEIFRKKSVQEVDSKSKRGRRGGINQKSCFFSPGDKLLPLSVISFSTCFSISQRLIILAWCSEIDTRLVSFEASRLSIVAWYDSFARKRAMSDSSYIRPWGSGRAALWEDLEGIFGMCIAESNFEV